MLQELYINAHVLKVTPYYKSTRLSSSVHPAKEPGRLTAFILAVDGTPTKLAEVVFDVAITGEPLDVEFCGPMAAGGVARVAVSFQDPHSASADGTVRLYQPLSALNAELTLVKDIAGSRSVQNSVVYST